MLALGVQPGTSSLTPHDPACVQIDPCRLASLNESSFWIKSFENHPYKRGERENPEWSASPNSTAPPAYTTCTHACFHLLAYPAARHLHLCAMGGHMHACACMQNSFEVSVQQRHPIAAVGLTITPGLPKV